jgi:hypothetical protein
VQKIIVQCTYLHVESDVVLQCALERCC